MSDYRTDDDTEAIGGRALPGQLGEGVGVLAASHPVPTGGVAVVSYQRSAMLFGGGPSYLFRSLESASIHEPFGPIRPVLFAGIRYAGPSAVPVVFRPNATVPLAVQ